MAFIPVIEEKGRYRRLLCGNGGSSQAYVKGDALADNGSGILVPATSSTATDVKYICMETKTITATSEMTLCYKVDEGVLIRADVDAAAAQTDVHTYADLATAATVNPDASSNDLFYIEKIDTEFGAVGTSTKILGYFTNGTPNS